MVLVSTSPRKEEDVSRSSYSLTHGCVAVWFLAQFFVATSQQGASAFSAPSTSWISARRLPLQLLAQPASLTEQTTWDLKFLLQSIPTEDGKKVDEFFSAKVQFIEEEGYEPPQGELKQIFDPTNDSDKEYSTPSFKIVSSRWQLSEDPNDRKDGLWVWGLFAEPLYPFMLLQIETDRVSLPGDRTDSIKPLKLYAQINHKRDKEKGVMLSGGPVNIREAETFSADPFNAATVTIYDDVVVGNLQIQVGGTSS